MKLNDIKSVNVLTEATVKSSGAAMGAIISYIEKKLGEKLIKIPGVEHFENSEDKGYGIRYVFDGSVKCLRFNWTGSPGSAATIQSIDIFTGKHDPSFSVQTKGISLVQSLPALVTVLKSPTIGKMKIFPVSPADAMAEEAVSEAKRDDFTSGAALQDFIRKLAGGKTFTRSEFIGAYHIVNVGIFDTVVSDFKSKFDVDSKKRVAIKAGAKIDSLIDSIMAKAGMIEVKSGGSGETYMKTKAEEAIEGGDHGDDRVPYGDVLEHLEGLVQGIIKGAFNALFVAGKGGTGKTQTVERVLHANGLTDGNGYFKNTGSASASGVYTLLYHHRNDIILFDDSDGALADQDARNLIKAATDTKKKRKLVWNKKSSFIFDPDQEDPEAYEDDLAMAPKFFDFEGRIIFISNLPLNKLDPDGALRTRAFVINVDPTDAEMFEHMEKILFDIQLEDGLSLSKSEKQEVLEVVKTSKRKGDVSLRKLVRALNLAASGAPNWKKLVELYS
jgi:hypothetical protein